MTSLWKYCVITLFPVVSCGSRSVCPKNGQSRTNDDLPDQPLQIQHEQKLAKYGLIADRNNLQFAPVVFSQIGQIYGPYKSLIEEQIRRHLIDFEGQAKPSKVKPVMKCH